MEITQPQKTLKIATLDDLPGVTDIQTLTARLYNTTLTLSGKRIELKKYTKPILSTFYRKTIRTPRSKTQPPELYKRRNDNLHRARKTVTNLIHCNLPITKAPQHKRPRFILFTYADSIRGNIRNRKAHKQDMAEFMRKLKKYLHKKELKYVWVIEKQPCGNTHFHVVFFELPYLDKNKIEQMWGHGFVKFKEIKTSYKDTKHTANYVGKYITKDADEKDMNERCYSTSLDLTKPTVVHSVHVIRSILNEAINKNYVITRKPIEYYLPFFDTTVKYELWEP